MLAPLPGVNMPRQDQDLNPFAERDEDGANSNQDWLPTPEPEDVPDPDTASRSVCVFGLFSPLPTIPGGRVLRLCKH